MIIIVMGVSGSGKTTIGRLLAHDLGWDFYDADDFHSPDNIAKMSRGLALDDEDRQPWIQSLRVLILDCLKSGKQAVIACSALKETYRTSLRVDNNVQFVYLKGSFEQIKGRLTNRQNHFMSGDLLADQFTTLEEPHDILEVDISLPPEKIVKEIRVGMGF
jgi:gluconokinase